MRAISFDINNIAKSNIKMIDKVEFKKGTNIPSNTYGQGLTPYLRVGDLWNSRKPALVKYIHDSNASKEDILIAFDGSPGRFGIGLKGIISGSLYKIVSKERKIDILASLLHKQNIFKMHSTGTTILHAPGAKKDIRFFKSNFNEATYKKLINIKE